MSGVSIQDLVKQYMSPKICVLQLRFELNLVRTHNAFGQHFPCNPLLRTSSVAMASSVAHPLPGMLQLPGGAGPLQYVHTLGSHDLPRSRLSFPFQSPLA